MKKLMTAFAACLMAGFVSAEVSSQNIVGYKTEEFPLFRGQPMQFQKVGGGVTLITDILDMSTVSPFDDVLEIYDINLGFVDYMWNGDSWFNTLTDEEIDIEVIPGNAFLVLASGTWLFAGEVASITTCDHPIEPGNFTFVGSAFPADVTLDSFDWSAIEPFSDVLELYDPNLGLVDYMWNGETWVNTLTDEELLGSTTMNDGFMLQTQLDKITQTL